MRMPYLAEGDPSKRAGSGRDSWQPPGQLTADGQAELANPSRWPTQQVANIANERPTVPVFLRQCGIPAAARVAAAARQGGGLKPVNFPLRLRALFSDSKLSALFEGLEGRNKRASEVDRSLEDRATTRR